MSINWGFIIAKALKLLNRPALRGCVVHKTAVIGSGSNCIGSNIGRYSYMGKNCVTVNASIGSFCSIASYCCIGGGSHPTNIISSSPLFYEGRNVFGKHFSKNHFKEAKPVNIGNDVWIGEKAFIKDGITIGDGAIIGAHSIVTHDVPPYAIMGGVPAKLIRYRFREDIIENILQTKWWSMNDLELKTFATYLENREVTNENISNAINQIK